MIVDSHGLTIDLADDIAGGVFINRSTRLGCGVEGCVDCHGEEEEIVYEVRVDLIVDHDQEGRPLMNHLEIRFTRNQLAALTAVASRSLSDADPEVWMAALDATTRGGV